MFNVIKGSVINKNVKPVVINPNKKRNEHVEMEEEHESAPLNKEVENTTEYNTKEYYQEYFDDTKERLDIELSEIEKQINQRREELAQIDTELEEIRVAATREAESIIANAKVEADEEVNNIKADAWDQGFQEGQSIGRDEVLSQADAIYQSANNLLEVASKKRKELLTEGRREVIDLAFSIAKRVIKKEVEAKEVLIKNIEDALEKAPKTKEMKLYINVEQLSLAPELKELISKKFSGLNLDIVEDLSIKPGGAIIETKLGRIDASIEGQLESLYDALGEV